MNTLLVIFGALFALLFALVALIQTVRRRPVIRRFEIALIFLIVFLPLVALALEAMETAGTAADQDRSLVLAALLGVFGLILMVIELFRPQRLRQSRGVLTLFSGVLLGLASLLIPFLVAYFSFVPDAEPTQPPSVAVAGSVTATTTPDDGETFMVVFSSVINVVAEESELSNDEVLTALDNGQTVADIVGANGGDLDAVVDQITVIMQDFLRELMQQDRLDRIRGAAGIASMRLVVEYAVNNDLASLGRSGEEDSGTAEPTPGEGTPRTSYFAFLTTTATPKSTDALSTEDGAGTSAATQVSTITALPTSRATLTRTPRPTATATPTLELFSTRTPSPTPTLPSPCLLLPLYNVNLRETPDLEAPLIITVPFETALNAYGRNDDASWWYVEYEGSAGWVKAEFVSATASCELLPVRRP